jgi:hypothetical protein
MAYRVVNVPWDEDEAWGARLLEELGHQEAEGFTLSAMTPRTVRTTAIQPIGGGPTHYVVQLVCVFHREGAP